MAGPVLAPGPATHISLAKRGQVVMLNFKGGGEVQSCRVPEKWRGSERLNNLSEAPI